ncbi:hypothetical protein ABH915_001065 [Arthrobacter sp. MW3 TE3886]
MELPIEECGLEDDVGPRAQRSDGLGVLGRQRGAVHRGGSSDVVHAVPGGRIPGTELRNETVKDLALVEVTQHRCVLEHLVLVEDRLGAAAQLLVEFPQQLKLATRGHHEVARGVDQVP